MSCIHIRKAGIDDAGLLLEVILQAFTEYRDNLKPPSGVFRETPATIQKKLKAGGGYLAIADDRTVGAVLYEPRVDTMYLGRLAVVPAYRGHGVARLLVEAVEAQARLLAFSVVELGVRLALTDNQAMFAHLGYAIHAYCCHPGFAEPTSVQMIKRL